MKAASTLPGKLGRKASALLLDVARFDDWVKEQGGADGSAGFERWFMAQISSGVTAKVLCGHYCVDLGLVGEWLTAEAGRLERYYRAQRWVADAFVSETVDIADGADAETLGADKLRVDTRFKIAEKLDPVRFGKQEAGLGAAMENLADVLQRISERKRAPVVIEAERLEPV